MPSLRSMQTFLLMNSFILLNTYIHHYHIFPSFLGSLYKNTLLFGFVCLVSRNKPYLHESPTLTFSFSYFLCGTSIDFLTHICMNSIAYRTSFSPYFLLLQLFMFEILFDFFHYWTHRISHIYPILYRFHKIHHSSHPVQASVTFQHHPIDLLLTNTLPLLICTYCIPCSHYFITIIMWYKTIQEIGGHTGKDIRSSSFIFCIWLPKLLGIELYSRDHALHHTMPMYNFSKRFSIWDKVFGTYYSSNKTIGA